MSGHLTGYVQHVGKHSTGELDPSAEARSAANTAMVVCALATCYFPLTGRVDWFIWLFAVIVVVRGLSLRVALHWFSRRG
jgi:hypothetical protein